jgi:hypothetical protein
VGIDVLRLKEPSPGFALEKVTISGGQYITASTTWARGKRERPIRDISNGYEDRLNDMGRQFIVLHDVETRTAWLTDGLSVLLHLVRANLHYANTEEVVPSLLQPQDLRAVGLKGALAALIDPTNLGKRVRRKLDKPNVEKYKYLVDTIKFIMHMIEQIVDHQADMRESSVGYRIRRSPLLQMEGFDFKDISMEAGLIYPRATTFCADAEGWVGLTQAIHAPTLFGRGFGHLLEPTGLEEGLDGTHRSRCYKCFWNEPVPPDRDLLAVPGSELERIVKNRGSKPEANKQAWRVVNDLYLKISPESFQCVFARSAAAPLHRRCQPRILRIQNKGDEARNLEDGEE